MADITRGVRAFTIGTAISRVFGLVREMVFAFLYGASKSTDAFQAAFRILDLLRDLFAESTLSAAAVPILTEQKQKDKQKENLLAGNLFNMLFITVGLIVAIGIFLSPFLAKILAFGFANIPGKLELTSLLTAIMFPFLLFIALAAWAMSYLNTEGEFFVPSFAPAFFNIFSIIIPVLLYSYLINNSIDPILGMAYGVVIGGLMQFFIQVPRLFKKGFRYRFHFNFKDPDLKRILALFTPVVIGLAGSRINVAVSVFLISFLAERSMTWLHYAFRVYHLPLGLFGIAVGTVALPTLSKYVTEQNLSELRKTLFDSLKLVFFLTISSSIIIAFLAHPITRVLYERGKFMSIDTYATAQALILFMMGVPFAGGLRNLASVFYAYKDTKTPMFASLISIVVNIGLNLILMGIIGFRAFPLSTSIATFVNIFILFCFLPRKIGSFDILPMIKYFVMLVISSVIGGFCGLMINNFLLTRMDYHILSQILVLICSLVIAFLGFYMFSLILGVKEVKEYVKRLVKV